MVMHNQTPENVNALQDLVKKSRNPIPKNSNTSEELLRIFGSVDRVHLEASIRMCLMRACNPEQINQVESFVQGYMTRLASLDTQYTTVKEAIIENAAFKKEELLASLEADKSALFAKAQTQIALGTLALDGKARAGVTLAMEGSNDSISPVAA